jgi:hypothetical protein
MINAHVNCLKPEALLCNIYKLSFQLMPFKEIIAVNSQNHIKLTNAPCGQNSELFVIKSFGTI